LVLLFLALAFIGGVALAENLNSLWNLLGKDPSLTGRTDIWAAVGDMIKRQPWAGYGFGSFWVGLDGPSGYVWQYAQWKTPHAHNGFLDILLQIGGIGLFLLMVSLVINLYRTVVLIRRDFSPELTSLAVLFLYIILCNFSESNFMVPNNLHWVLYIVISYRLSEKCLVYKQTG
jgi:O-antigen ligase